MIKYRTTRSLENIQPFFSEHGICKEIFVGPGQQTLSIDGTGSSESVTEDAANQITRYIKEKFYREDGLQLRVMDIGTGMGRMVNALLHHGLDGFGLEGFADLARRAHSPKEKLLVADLGLKITEPALHKAFDLTTSFELLEHIHRSQEDIFLANLAHFSNYHLCSIHLHEWPGTNPFHCNIKHACCWLELFRKHNITYEVLGRATKCEPDPAYSRDSGAFGGKLPAGLEEFRAHVKFPQADQWECSMFVLLDLRSFS
jgi:hypothetical protein